MGLEHSVRRLCGAFLGRLLGNVLDRVSTHDRNVRSAGGEGQSQRGGALQLRILCFGLLQDRDVIGVIGSGQQESAGDTHGPGR
jgi:hypothetical protein